MRLKQGSDAKERVKDLRNIGVAGIGEDPKGRRG